MPDQSSASTEHALLQEITAPLSTLPDDPLQVTAAVDFPVVLRGYDRIAVDAYVKQTSQLVAELQATRSPESAVRRALERVGEEVSGILKRAHETAAQITAQSRSEADDRLEAARQEASEITAEAHNRVKDLDAETDRIWSERHRMVEDTRELARQLLSLSASAADRFPADEGADAAPGLDDQLEIYPEVGPEEPDALPEGEAGPAGTPVAGAEANGASETAPPASDEEAFDDETVERQATSIMPPVRAPHDDG